MEGTDRMEIINGLDFQLQNSSVSLGKFDGVHRGHRFLLQEIQKNKSYIPTVFTFAMNTEIPKLYTQEEKNRVLEEIGIQREVVFPFNETTKHMSPEEFVEEILVKKMDAKHICVGKDFHFGKDRGGDIHTLERFQKKYGYELVTVPKLYDDGQVISSTRVRALMDQGNMRKVNELLERPFFVQGTVCHGEALGRTIGFPTANLLAPKGKKLPPFGVYATKVHCGTKVYAGVTNVGNKPTVGSFATGIETCILDFEKDIYGKEIQVEFYEFIRPEMKFATLDDLKAQIAKDKSKAQRIG